ncbi:MAG TPA: hypothetical protein VK154_04300 [Chitinophagales bacterium]|nr:hypothetical protein [Chitinophagales bacterium]
MKPVSIFLITILLLPMQGCKKYEILKLVTGTYLVWGTHYSAAGAGTSAVPINSESLTITKSGKSIHVVFQTWEGKFTYYNENETYYHFLREPDDDSFIYFYKNNDSIVGVLKYVTSGLHYGNYSIKGAKN